MDLLPNPTEEVNFGQHGDGIISLGAAFKRQRAVPYPLATTFFLPTLKHLPN